jgi:glycerophosphoryl diester phosphodiesterase
MENDPLIIGHRGAAAVAPENTLASFERAMLDGADGIEFDVRISSDGVPVVIHDATLTRTASIKKHVANLSAAELALIDVGSWFARQQSADTDYSGEKLPNLHQVLDLFKQRDALLYLEMKSETGELALPNVVVDAIKNQSMQGRVIVSGFDMSLIREIKRIDKNIRTAALFEPKISRPFDLVRRKRLIDIARANGADEIALHYRLFSSRIVEKARRSHMEVVIWTVDNPQWIDRGRMQGIKALITNNPAVMVQYRQQHRLQ